MILISAVVLGVTLLVPPQASDQRAEAERMANSGNYAAALKQFQTIAAANPDDIEARLWIARLHARLGHPEHAVDVYRSILAVQPQHVDALIGLGQSLTTLGRLREASDALQSCGGPFWLTVPRSWPRKDSCTRPRTGRRSRSRTMSAPSRSIHRMRKSVRWRMRCVQSADTGSRWITTSSTSTRTWPIRTRARSSSMPARMTRCVFSAAARLRASSM